MSEIRPPTDSSEPSTTSRSQPPGLVTLQAASKPELKDLASAITVATDENRVLVNARIPYETLDALTPHRPVASGGDAK